MEDDKKIASFLSKGLKQEGFAVDHVTNGEEGLHLALHEPYDVAIVDIMLPKLDGLSLIEEVVELYRYVRRKKIFVSTPLLIKTSI